MKVKLDVTPDLAAMMAAEIKAGEKAVSAATREAGTSLKTAWRAQITGAGLGQRLSRTIRSAKYPKSQPSLNAAALVWSNAPEIVQRARHRPADPLEGRLLADHSFACRRPRPARRQDHPG